MTVLILDTLVTADHLMDCVSVRKLSEELRTVVPVLRDTMTIQTVNHVPVSLMVPLRTPLLVYPSVSLRMNLAVTFNVLVLKTTVEHFVMSVLLAITTSQTVSVSLSHLDIFIFVLTSILISL